ncbi:YbjN domain-containing protein [Haloglycomyces albus]|uniref:YbjN domain-containing protein n=1 Tax=Haloglycomyces albus TaxID=526067 RepID=UPI00046CB594|nr:YbjN domain-containing protein [Haloglycomyces albus]
MAWWRNGKKRDSEKSSGAIPESMTEEFIDERSEARGSQPEAIPEQATFEDLVSYERDHIDFPQLHDPAESKNEDADRWQLIKQDLEDIDPTFMDDLRQIASDSCHEVRHLTSERIIEALQNLGIRYLVDDRGSLVALWERHVVQLRSEGPDEDILVLRCRAYQTVPKEFNLRAYAAVNEWNRTRRFLKAYVGEPTDSGALPVFGEMQVPVRPGISIALLEELIDCATAVSGAYVEWLEGEVL